MKIAVIGSTNIDVVSYIDKIPAGGETRAAQNFHTAHGGKGANQAVAAAKLGADVLMVSAVGDDMFGKGALENFKQNKIDTSRVSIIEGVATGEATIIVEASGQNRILIYKGANDKLTPELLMQAADDLKKCGLIVLQLEIPLETVYAAIDFANENKIPVLLNPAPAVKELSIEMACKCDFFVPNETELSILTDMPVNSREEIKAAANSLLSKGLKNIIVTMGSKGALWLSSEREEFVPARKVQAVDSTGAGDSFIGCFVEHYIKTADVFESMKRASLYATLSVTKKGTQDSYATVDEFKKFCAEIF
ncbi:MAG: ribokinase [Selenomonadaceae bacterium]|nr:ribokinase [Selenomonadaceae bacterium]